jgi:glucosamine-6-phosphate deaminase
MEIILKKTQEEASRLGARIIAQVVKNRPHPIIGFATGGSPLLLYRELIRMHHQDGLSLKTVTGFNLDEYAGIPANHPASFSTYMDENLFRHVDVLPENIHIPDGNAPDVSASCAAYEQKIQATGGIALQILGIGEDGHLAFNEPSSSLASRTRIKTLTRVTRRANAEPFGGEEKVPRHVITMGLGSIMDAEMCLLLAFGARKAEAVKNMVEGPVSAMCPASILQCHERVVILLDEPAAALLSRREYYQEVYEGKPEWQKWE